MIIFESNNLLVVDKKAGIVVEDLANNLKDEIEELKELPRYGLAHRLDKDTSGVLLFGKNEITLNSLKKSFKDRKVSKKYICLVWREMKKKKGKIITAMRRGKNDRRKHQSYPPEEEGRKAISFYKVLENFENYSLIEVIPKTGRRHQIRSQFAFLGHPVVGDKLYSFKDQRDPVEMKRHFLHNRFLEIKTKNGKKRFESELPMDLKKIIDNLKK